jgi:beta-lactamase regulating signal transducer with metallopeptidase domain
MSAGWMQSMADAWSVWAVGALADGVVTLLVAGVLWVMFRKMIPARWGMWLFLLVMMKSLIPTPVEMPGWGTSWLGKSSEAGGTPASGEVTLPVLEDDQLPEEPGVAHSGETPSPWRAKDGLFIAWSIGVVTGFLLLGLRAWKTWRLVREARPLRISEIELDPGWVSRLDLGGISLRESGALSSPAAWGGGSPCVILPEGLAGKLNLRQLRWTLAHEVSHLRHGDWAVALAQSVCGLFCFFNPAVWVASIAASALRERACDEAAVRMAEIPAKESASGFLRVVEWAQEHASPGGVMMQGLSLEGRTIHWRLRKLLSGITPQRQSSVMMAAVLLALVLLLPSFRSGLAEDAYARGEILRLQAQVVDLEDRLQRKSDREARLELNRERASRRVAADAGFYNGEQREAIETIYQEARRKMATADKEAAYAILSERYPRSNRTGCARLFSARGSTGAVRESKLREVISESGDCFYLDGTSVGAVARVVLVKDLLAAGRKDEAAEWLNELERDFSGYLDHEGNPIEETVRELSAGL